MCVTAFLHSVLTNSQLCDCFLVQPAELCSVDVVGFKDADELLQSFLAQPSLHILLRPISKQQPGVTRQLPSCKKHTTGREEVLCYYTPVSCNTTYLMQTNNFPSHSTEKDTIPRSWYGGWQLLSCTHTHTHTHTHTNNPKRKLNPGLCCQHAAHQPSRDPMGASGPSSIMRGPDKLACCEPPMLMTPHSGRVVPIAHH